MIGYLNYLFQKEIDVEDQTLQFARIKKTGIGKRFKVLSGEKSDTSWKARIFTSGVYCRENKNQLLKRANLVFRQTIERGYPPQLVVAKEQKRELNNILEKYIDTEIMNLLEKKLNDLVN